MARDVTNSEWERNVAVRLRAVMTAFGIQTKKAMGEICGASESSVGNWISGDRAKGGNLPKVQEMSRLCDRTGLTLDWIYRGSMATMDAKLGLHLAKLIEGGELF
jgi:hypothetical protein